MLRAQAQAFSWLRAYTWFNARPAGGPCRCCLAPTQRACLDAAPAVHRSADVRARALSDTAVRWEFVTAGSTTVGAAKVTARLRAQEAAERGALADAEACVVEAVAQVVALPAVGDPVVPMVLACDAASLATDAAARRVALGQAMGRVRLRRGIVAKAASTTEWWPSFVTGSIATSRRRARARATAAAAVARAVSRGAASTAQQRAEREQTARREFEASAAARAEILRRRAAARLAAQEARRSRQLPAAAVDAALQEAMRRAGPTLAMQPGGSAQCAGGDGEVRDGGCRPARCAAGRGEEACRRGGGRAEHRARTAYTLAPGRCEGG